MALLSIKRQVLSATVKPPEKPSFRISVTAPNGNSGQSITLPIAITDVFGLPTELSNRPLTSYVDQIVQAANSVRELADVALQAGLDAEIANRIDAILNILFLLESKADLVGGFIPTSQIPAVAITEYLGIAVDQAEMLALVGQIGDWCHRTDLEKAFIILGEDTTDLGAWKEWPMPVSPVTSINGQVGVVVLGKSDIGLGNVPDIDATKRENHTGTQLASSITGLATVATSGSYDDLSNKPTIESDKVLVHKTLTRWKNRSNNSNHLPFSLELRGVFDTNFVIPANTLIAGDVYRFEMTVFINLATTQANTYEIAPIVNNMLLPFNPTALGITTGTLNSSQTFTVVFDIIFPTVGGAGRITQNGFVVMRNAVVTFDGNFTAIDTTQAISLNYSARFSAPTVGAGNAAYIKSARLYKLNDPV